MVTIIENNVGKIMVKKFVKKLTYLKQCTTYKGNKYKVSPVNKVIRFKNRNFDILTDDDIKNLFIGLINLVKSNTQKLVERKYKQQLTLYQNQLQSTSIRVLDLESQLRKLKERV